MNPSHRPQLHPSAPPFTQDRTDKVLEAVTKTQHIVVNSLAGVDIKSTSDITRIDMSLEALSLLRAPNLVIPGSIIGVLNRCVWLGMMRLKRCKIRKLEAMR